MDYIVSALRLNPELAIFLTVAIGFLIGRVRFGSFSLGIVVGCLLAGVLVGQLDIKVSPLVKTVFFDLFLFTTGYKVGPQFFRGLKSDALPQMALTVVLCVTCLLVAFGFSKLLGYDVGTAAGLLAGAFSESTVIGTAGDAIQRLTIPEADKAALINNIPVAYAVTYLVGTAALVWFIPTIGPKLMGVNLRDEGARMRANASSASQTADGVMSAARTFDLRAYRVANPTGSAGRSLRSRLCRREYGLSSCACAAANASSRRHETWSSKRTMSWRSPPGTRCTRQAGMSSGPRSATSPCSTYRSRRWMWW